MMIRLCIGHGISAWNRAILRNCYTDLQLRSGPACMALLTDFAVSLFFHVA
jgi:hypothetical protein